MFLSSDFSVFSVFCVFQNKKKNWEPNVLFMFSLFFLFFRIESSFQKQEPNYLDRILVRPDDFYVQSPYSSTHLFGTSHGVGTVGHLVFR